MMKISDGMDDPKIDSSISAKISGGIAIRTSTARLISWSVQPRLIAATSPNPPPMAKARIVVTKAMPIVFRAP